MHILLHLSLIIIDCSFVTHSFLFTLYRWFFLLLKCLLIYFFVCLFSKQIFCLILISNCMTKRLYFPCIMFLACLFPLAWFYLFLFFKFCLSKFCRKKIFGLASMKSSSDECIYRK